MPIIPKALDVEAIETAVEHELTTQRRALPPDPATPALIERLAEVTQWVYEKLSGDFMPTPEETVAVNKGRHGVRPVAIWDFASKTAYRALAWSLLPKLPPHFRGKAEWQDFLKQPLNRDGRYIVATDIAACYQQIDHGLLRNELLVQTGEFQTVSAIIELLHKVTGKTYGLPQQSYPSDWISEVFLARLERSLVRRGIEATRYNDDFRFVCADWSGVVRAIEIFDEEVRTAGLTVNDQKTLTWGKAKYEDQIEFARALREEITGEEDPDIEPDYEDEDGESTPAFDWIVAEDILERWTAIAGRSRVSKRRRAEHRVIVDLIPEALKVLANEGRANEDLVRDSIKLLRFERTVTPSVGRYLSSVRDEMLLLNGFDKLLRSRSYLNGWQTWWLQQPVARLSGFASGSGSTRRLNWARAAFRSAEHSPVLRAEAARTLARHGEIKLEELLAIYDRSNDITRPALASAIALLRPSRNIRNAIAGDSKMNLWTYEWATQWV